MAIGMDNGSKQAMGAFTMVAEGIKQLSELAVGARDKSPEGNELAPLANMATGPALAIGKEEAKGFGGEAMRDLAKAFLGNPKV